jgi:hypothetical protein
MEDDAVRINVYEEELTGDVEIVIKDDVIGEDGEYVTFRGIRIWLKGADELHLTDHDDDRPAVTFWAREWIGLREIADQIRKATDF